MTTKAFSYNIDHSTDLAFNQWASTFSQALSDIGMVQTADTGQSTFLGSPLVPRPGTNSDAGYQVWRTNDTIIGSPQVPIYCKFRFGTYSGTDRPRLFLDVGTGTDGAGTVTGATRTGISLTVNNAPTNGTGPCYFCHTDGFLGFAYGIDNYSVTYPLMAHMGLFLARSANPDGTHNGNAIFIQGVHGTTTYVTGIREQRKDHVSLNLSTGTAYGGSSDGTNGIGGGYLPTNSTQTTVDADGNIAVFPHMSAAPQPFIIPTLVSGWNSDIPDYTTFTTTVLGSTPRTYLSLRHLVFGSGGMTDVGQSYQSLINVGMVWE